MRDDSSRHLTKPRGEHGDREGSELVEEELREGRREGSE